MERETPFTFRVVAYSGLLLGYILLYILVNHFSLRDLTHGYLSGVRGDPGIYLWATHHNIYSLFHDPLNIFESGTFYPFGKGLAYTDNYLLPSIITLLFLPLCSSFALAFNLPLLLAAGLNGLSVFLLVRRLTRESLVSFVAGLCFMLLPFFSFHLGHPQLQYAFFIPFTILSLICFFERRSFVSATLIGMNIAFCFLCSVYYALYCCLLVMVWSSGYAIMRFRTLGVRDFCVLIAANLPWIVVLLAITRPYIQTRQALDAQHISLVKNFSATLLSYLSVPASNYLWGGVTSKFTHLESFLFPGGLTLLLAAIAIALLLRGKIDPLENPSERLIARLLLIMLVLTPLIVAVCFGGFHIDRLLRRWVVATPFWIVLVFSFTLLIYRSAKCSTWQALSGYETKLLVLFSLLFFMFASMGVVGTHTEKIFRPEIYYYLYKFFPGFNAMRATSRIGLVTDLFIILFAAYGLHFLVTKIKRVSSITASAICIVASVIVVVELRTAHARITDEPTRPSVYQRLAEIPDRAAAISLPFRSPQDRDLRFIREQTDFIRWHQGDPRPVVNGFSGKIPAFHQFLGRDLDKFPDAHSLNTLSRIVGLKYIVLPKKYYGKRLRKIQRKVEKKYSDRLKVKTRVKSGIIFELFPAINLATAEPAELLLPPAPLNRRRLVFEMRFQGETVANKKKIKIRTGAVVSESGERQDIWQDLELTTEWKKYELVIPPTLSAVRPQRINFSGINGAEVWIKEPAVGLLATTGH